MTTQSRQRLSTLVESVLACEAKERNALLDKASHGDPFLRHSLALTAVAFVVARRRRWIGGRLPGVALALWLAAGLGFALRWADQIRWIVDSGVALERAFLVLGPGMLALAVAPLALAPLAVAWNRHR